MALKYYSHVPGFVRVRLLQSVVVNSMPHRVGEVLDIPGGEAMYLIGRQVAEAVAAPEAPAEKTTTLGQVRAQVLGDAEAPLAPPQAISLESSSVAAAVNKDVAEEEVAEEPAAGHGKKSRARK